MPDFPYRNPTGWQVQIGSVLVPVDVCTVAISGLKTSIRLDKQAGSGRSGATIRYLGDELAAWTIDLTAWSQAGFDVLFAVCALAKKQQGQPLTVYHPLLTEGAGVDRMIVESVEWPNGVVSGGVMTAKLTCTQWAPAPKTPKKSVATTPKVAGAPPDLYSKTNAPLTPPALPPGPSATTPKP